MGPSLTVNRLYTSKPRYQELQCTGTSINNTDINKKRHYVYVSGLDFPIMQHGAPIKAQQQLIMQRKIISPWSQAAQQDVQHHQK